MEHILKHLIERQQSADGPILAQRVYLLLGQRQRAFGLAGPGIHKVADLARRRAQIAQQRLIAHDGTVIEHIGRRGRDVHQLKKILLGVFVPRTAQLHLVEHRDRVDALAEREHGEYRFVYLAVLVDIKFVGLDLLDHIRHAAGVDEDRAEYGLFGLRGIRHPAAKQFLHGEIPAFCFYLSSITSTWTVPLIS